MSTMFGSVDLRVYEIQVWLEPWTHTLPALPAARVRAYR